MRSHDEYQKRDLGEAKDFPAEIAKQDFTGISHIEDTGMLEFELADHEASVGCEAAQTENQDYATSKVSRQQTSR